MKTWRNALFRAQRSVFDGNIPVHVQFNLNYASRVHAVKRQLMHLKMPVVYSTCNSRRGDSTTSLSFITGRECEPLSRLGFSDWAGGLPFPPRDHAVGTSSKPHSPQVEATTSRVNLMRQSDGRSSVLQAISHFNCKCVHTFSAFVIPDSSATTKQFRALRGLCPVGTRQHIVLNTGPAGLKLDNSFAGRSRSDPDRQVAATDDGSQHQTLPKVITPLRRV